MPPQVAQGKAPTLYKQGALVKDVIPTTVKNIPRQGKPVQIPQNVQPNTEQQQILYIPYADPQQWPGQEAAQAFDFGINSGKVFQDPVFHKIDHLPSDYVSGNDILFWRRASEYVKSDDSMNGDQSSLSLRIRHYQRRGSMQEVKEEVSEVFDTSIDDMAYNSPLPKKFKDPVDNPQGIDDEEENSFTLVPAVFNSYERDETPEELEQRKKELEIKLAEQKNKKGAQKPGKGKQEVIPDTLIKIKQARLSNIDMSLKYPADGQWIASQLQIIKDRNILDVHSNKPIWTQIYPQQDGVPIINPSGRYWVKLYYFGQERKIEVDDTVPLTVRGHSRFPQSVHKNEIWTQIFTKALLKLHFLTEGHVNVAGSGFIMYALTGMVNQRVSLQGGEINWTLVKQALRDDNFRLGNIHLACYSSSSHKISAPSNQIRNSKEAHIDMITNERQAPLAEIIDQDEDDQTKGIHHEQEKKGDPNTTGIHKPLRNKKRTPTITSASLNEKYQNNPTVRSKIKQIEIETKSDKPTYIIKEFAYPLVDSFFNETFNMVYVQKRGEQEIQLRQQLFEISKTTMHQMTKEEKLEFRKKKKDLREKINEEDRKRVDLITKPPIQYRFLRVRTLASKTPMINILNPFTFEEIQLAQQCVLNKLTKPPNYELPEIRDDGKSVVSATVRGGHQDEQFVVKPLDDFSTMPYATDPMNRGKGGVWIQEQDFVGCFDQIMIFYNPRKLKNFKFIEVPTNPDTEVILNEENQVIIIQKNEEDQEEPNKLVQLLFSFDYQTPQNNPFIKEPYAILQRFDFSSFTSLMNYESLTRKTVSSLYEQTLKNSNQVFRISLFSPVNFYLQLACDNPIRTLSVLQYLTEIEGYSMKNFTIEHPALEANKFHVFFRFRINPLPNSQQIIVKVKSSNDNYNLTFFRFKLVEYPTNFNDVMFQTIEGVHKNLYESSVPYSNYTRFVVQPDTQYFLILEGVPQYAVQEGNLEIEYYFQSPETTIDNLEQVDPLEFVDQYVPYQYGILFRERIFLNDENLATFYLRIANIQGGAPPVVVDPKAKAPPKKTTEVVELVQTPVKQERLLKLELFEGDNLIQYSYGVNSALISNAILFSTQNEAKSYYLQASFDLREWPECKFSNPQNQQIHWILRVSATDTIGVVKDTKNEDLIQSIKKSWQDKEPGRLDQAQKARQKFMIQIKKEHGEQLTEEEIQLISEPRLSQKQREQEAQAALQKGAQGGAKAPPPQQDDQKGAKGPGGKQVQVVEEQKEVRPIPQSENHNMNEIHDFLEHMEKDRFMEQYASHAGLINIRDQDNLKQFLDGFQMGNEDLAGLFARNIYIREQLKLYQKDLKLTRLTELQMLRTEWKESWDEYIKEREKIKQKLTSQIQKEKEILDLCKSEKPNISIDNFEKLIAEQSNNPEFNKEILEIAQKVVKNLKILALNDQINDSLNNFDVNVLQNCIEDFEQYQVTGIENDVIEQANAMLEEAADNPNFQAEQQAEAQKAGKKPGKQ